MIAPEENEQVGGNKQTPTVDSSFQCKKWVMTWNNYPNNAIEQIERLVVPLCKHYTFGREKGEQGTRHIQGAFILKSKKRQNVFYKLLGCKFFMDKMKGDWEHQEYCKKEGDYITSDVEPEKVYVEEPQEWCKPLIDMIDNYDYHKGDRKIHVVIDKQGGKGKTEFCRWVFMNKERALMTGGKSADMKNQIVEYQKANKVLPRIMLIDVPRSILNFISWGGIEEIKNMFFYSGKYEGGMICGNKPVVIMFMNEEPDINMMSEDRWNLIEI
ncbi:MAG: replication protein [Circoviridae sp.]|nr:MAG: replication protein [Circoviridae sp.]